ncbi:MAG: hypothetical protein OXF75_11375 [Acidimicrobiaceae bacterium]|nr:hypothetical protein [Acidimicrobiaceae bacterium]
MPQAQGTGNYGQRLKSLGLHHDWTGGWVACNDRSNTDDGTVWLVNHNVCGAINRSTRAAASETEAQIEAMVTNRDDDLEWRGFRSYDEAFDAGIPDKYIPRRLWCDSCNPSGKVVAYKVTESSDLR